MASNMKRGLESRALRAMIGHAIFRLESALTIALTLVLIFLYPAPFPWWRWWYWLLIGVIGEALILFTSLSDAATAKQVVADMLRQTCNPSEIRSPGLRAQVERALEYRERMSEAIARAPAGALREHLEEMTTGISDWIGNIFNLARRLDTYERDELIRSDLASVQAALQQLRARLSREGDEAVRAELEATIRGKELQQQNLTRLQSTMERARLQMEGTLAAMGTVYSQLLLVGARDVGSAHSRRIAESIQEQVAALNDLLSAMNDVYSGQA